MAPVEEAEGDLEMLSKLADMREQLKEIHERSDLSKEDHLKVMGQSYVVES